MSQMVHVDFITLNYRFFPPIKYNITKCHFVLNTCTHCVYEKNVYLNAVLDIMRARKLNFSRISEIHIIMKRNAMFLFVLNCL